MDIVDIVDIVYIVDIHLSCSKVARGKPLVLRTRALVQGLPAVVSAGVVQLYMV